jgi:hypothetical protein
LFAKIKLGNRYRHTNTHFRQAQHAHDPNRHCPKEEVWWLERLDSQEVKANPGAQGGFALARIVGETNELGPLAEHRRQFLVYLAEWNRRNGPATRAPSFTSVPSSDTKKGRYQEQMARHHYLGALPKIGETVWYGTTESLGRSPEMRRA